MKSGLPSRPKHVNLSGRLLWRPLTWSQVGALAETARAAGLHVEITADCTLLAHQVCQQYGRPHRDVLIRSADAIDSLIDIRAACPEHGAVAVGV